MTSAPLENQKPPRRELKASPVGPAIHPEANGMPYPIGDLIQERLPHWRIYALSLTRNRAAAEDLVQDTVVRVLASMERFDGRSFASWSNTILRNRFIDGFRHSQFRHSSAVDREDTAFAQPASQEIVVEMDETLRAIASLAPKYRRILVLACVHELSYAGTARHLGIPIGTVRSRLSRARAELLATLDGKAGGARGGEISSNPAKSPSRRKAVTIPMPPPEPAVLLAA